jgi:hypothetical protein
LSRLKPLTHEVDHDKVVPRGEGSGEGVDDTLLSVTLGYINLTKVVIGLVVLREPIHLCACVSEECGDRDGEGSDSQVLSLL